MGCAPSQPLLYLHFLSAGLGGGNVFSRRYHKLLECLQTLLEFLWEKQCRGISPKARVVRPGLKNPQLPRFLRKITPIAECINKLLVGNEVKTICCHLKMLPNCDISQGCLHLLSSHKAGFKRKLFLIRRQIVYLIKVLAIVWRDWSLTLQLAHKVNANFD